MIRYIVRFLPEDFEEQNYERTLLNINSYYDNLIKYGATSIEYITTKKIYNNYVSIYKVYVPFYKIINFIENINNKDLSCSLIFKEKDYYKYFKKEKNNNE